MDNSVAEQLWNLPSYYSFVNDMRTIKSEVKYNFWGRPTIGWTLECEEKGNTRENAVSYFALELKKDSELQNKFVGSGTVGCALIAFFAFAGFCCFAIPFVICKGEGEAAVTELTIATIVNRLCWTLFSLLCLARLGKLRDITEANLAKIEGY